MSSPCLCWQAQFRTLSEHTTGGPPGPRPINASSYQGTASPYTDESTDCVGTGLALVARSAPWYSDSIACSTTKLELGSIAPPPCAQYNGVCQLEYPLTVATRSTGLVRQTIG